MDPLLHSLLAQQACVGRVPSKVDRITRPKLTSCAHRKHAGNGADIYVLVRTLKRDTLHRADQQRGVSGFLCVDCDVFRPDRESIALTRRRAQAGLRNRHFRQALREPQAHCIIIDEDRLNGKQVAAPHKGRDERRLRRAIERTRRVDLLDTADIHDGDPVREAQSLALIMGHEDCADAGFLLYALDLDLH